MPKFRVPKCAKTPSNKATGGQQYDAFAEKRTSGVPNKAPKPQALDVPMAPNSTRSHGKAQIAVHVSGDPNTNADAAKAIHLNAVAGVVYALALQPKIGRLFPEPLDQSAMLYVESLIDRMAPRDPAEEMLVVQLALAHARVLHLTHLANQQDGLETIKTTHEYADRAHNTYRRLMLALAEYRRPPRTGDTFAVVKQANIAGQQVIQNHENSTRNATNEQGKSPDHCGSRDGQERPPALPADTGGIGVSPFNRSESEAVGAVHWPADTRGQSAIPIECDEAR